MREFNGNELVSRKQDTRFRVADDGSLRMNDRWVVPEASELHQDLLWRAHYSRYSIHLGGKRMSKDLCSHFLWKGMKRDVISFVRRCLNFQQIKAERRRTEGELRSLEVPTWKWEHISMDFVTHLPTSTRTIDAIWMAPFEALYRRLCRSPLYWDNVDRAVVTSHEMIQEMEQKLNLIQQRLKAAQDRHAAYANKRRRPLEFQQGNRVFLKVSPFCGTMKGKLAPRYVGLYEIFQRIDTLAYRLALPLSLSDIHDVFHMSMLPKYEPDPSHVLDISEVQLDPDVSYVERPVCILDRSERNLRSKLIPMMKVQWEHRVFVYAHLRGLFLLDMLQDYAVRHDKGEGLGVSSQTVL
ncbi:uncharacterized protein LOC142530611 [Primulina tabacum]|uniref:uncharacterized protein LOC142530611 n=1 Tax=Primulina tabacum TaxID=48773 RepID=UPI003F596CDA